MGLLPACVGTVPCTWLHTASLFWHVNTFWRPLGHSLVTTGILAVFCHLWAAGMPTQLLGAPQGWVALKTGCICHAPNQNGHSKPLDGARHGMGAKTPFSFEKSVGILRTHHQFWWAATPQHLRAGRLGWGTPGAHHFQNPGVCHQPVAATTGPASSLGAMAAPWKPFGTVCYGQLITALSKLQPMGPAARP